MLVRAPDYIPLQGPLLFIAGPIQGASFWQDEAIALIQQEKPELHIACPRRQTVFQAKDFTDEMHAIQVDWETYHLRRAAQEGSILFWLANEKEVVPGRSYAQTSRLELGNWMECARRKEVSLVIGIEDGFSNARYIKRRLSQDAPWVPVVDNLKIACQEAARLAYEPPERTFIA